MNEDLPSSFDVVVIGTGLTESIVSAAAARNGHTVLHIDPRSYYGGKWATFSWNEWISGDFSKIVNTFTSGDLSWTNDIREFEQVWYTDDADTKQDLDQSSRKFNIDVFPKVLMAREEIIQLLIQSNVSRYLEFKCITKLTSSLLPPCEAIIESIPISKSDIFMTKAITLVEKRTLMRFIEYVLKTPLYSQTSADGDNLLVSEPRPEDAPEPKTFEELANMHKLTSKLKHLIQSAVRTMDDCSVIAMKEEMGSGDFNADFMKRCRLFLQSIGRYGNQTPFLWTLYGLSEICQAFCRLSAIYGAIFILKRSVEAITQEESTGQIILKSDGVDIRAKYLVLGPDFKLAQPAKQSSQKHKHGTTLVRGVLLVNGPRLKSDFVNEGNLVVYRLGDTDVFELDDSSFATTKYYRLLHVTTPYRASDVDVQSTPRAIIESRLKPYLDFTYKPPIIRTSTNPDISDGRSAESDFTQTIPDKTVVLYGSYFFIDFFEFSDFEDSKNIFSCATSSTELTDQLRKANHIFHEIYPGEEFLPKAPDAPEVTADSDEEEDAQENSVVATNGVIGTENPDSNDLGPEENIGN